MSKFGKRIGGSVIGVWTWDHKFTEKCSINWAMDPLAGHVHYGVEIISNDFNIELLANFLVSVHVLSFIYYNMTILGDYNKQVVSFSMRS